MPAALQQPTTSDWMFQSTKWWTYATGGRYRDASKPQTPKTEDGGPFEMRSPHGGSFLHSEAQWPALGMPALDYEVAPGKTVKTGQPN